MTTTRSRFGASCRSLPELRPAIVRALARFPEVRAIYLFGSVAAGCARADSDIDVAVVTDCPLGALSIDMQAALVAEGLDDVDLVSLASADPVLRFEAVRHNCLLFAREDFDHGSFVSRTLRAYADVLPHPERQRAAVEAGDPKDRA